MKARIIYLLVGILSITTLKAQDVRYTQIHSTPLRLNPALMGANYHYKFNLGYRSQWSSVGDGFTTAQFTFMTPILVQENGHKLDVGLSVISDEQGAFSTSDAALSVGYTLQLSSTGHFLSTAINGGYVQNSLDANSLTFDEQYQQGSFDATTSTGETFSNDQINYIDAGLGVLWFYNPERDGDVGSMNAFAGVSAFHVNEPVVSFYDDASPLARRITTFAGVKIFTNGKLDFTPQMRYDDQDGASEFATGIYTGYNVNDNFRGILGIWYRNQDALAFVLGVNWKYLTIGYSYDLPGNEVSTGINNASVNEITLGVKLNRKSKEETFNPSPFGSN